MKYDYSAIVSDNRAKLDMSETIAMLVPSEAPFVALSKRITKEAAKAPEYNWLERDLEARFDAVNNVGGYAADATEIVVDHGTYFRKGMNVKVPRTGEVLRVTGISTNTLTIVRGFGETSAAALNDDDVLMIIGNANEEGSGAPDDMGGSPTKVSNFTQIFKTPFSVTNTANATNVYGGKLLTQEQKQAGIMHRIDMERAYLFGEAKEDTTGTHPVRTTRGLLGFLTQNITDAGGTLTEAEFNSWLEGVFAYGSTKRLLLASPKLISVVSSWGLGKLQTVTEANAKYGLNVVEYVSPHGTLNIVKEPLFEGTVYGGYGVALDMSNIKYRYLQGRDTTLLTNIQDNDVDGRRDQYITEAGLEVRLPKCHGVLTGVTG